MIHAFDAICPVVSIPIRMSFIELSISASIFWERQLLKVTAGDAWVDFTYLFETGVWGGSVKPYTLNALRKFVSAEFVCLLASDDLYHVWVPHGKDYIGSVVHA